jgi:undecaprenyl-diphosphatase
LNIFQAIILGIVQGITEFLPISSTAHLTIMAKLMGIIQTTDPEDWTAFMAMMQLGTAAAVVTYFFKDYLNISRGIYNDFKNQRLFSLRTCSSESRLAWNIIIGTLPVAIIGLMVHNFIEGTFTKETSVIASSLIIFAILLAIAEKSGTHKRSESQTTWIDAILIGIAQVIALIPGSSRSGTTITAGLFLGLDRETAARFSFHLSIPAILASGLYQMYKARLHIFDNETIMLLTSTLVSGVVGYLSISFLLHYLHKHSTLIFIVYRIILGILLWLQITTGLV